MILTKSEIRISKSETNSNNGNPKLETGQAHRRGKGLEHWDFGFRACFGFRDSDFGFQARRGVVLVAVLVVVAILMLVGYQFHRWMTAEAEAAAVTNRLAQGRHLADSGLHYAAFVLAYPPTAGIDGGDGSLFPAPGSVYDNSALFHRRPVSGPNTWPGYYSIVVPRDLDDPQIQSQCYRFGVEDESGKINVNALLRLDPSGRLARDMLMKLPNMTQETADAILNWTRKSNEVSESANNDRLYYGELGYTLKNGPYESPEELLFIRGITPRMFLGNDANRNGLLDPEEDDANGVLDPGLARLLTIYSRERNVDSQLQPRINVNENDLNALYDKLLAAVGEEMANWIIAYRLYGRPQGNMTVIIDMSASLRVEATVEVVAQFDVDEGSLLLAVQQKPPPPPDEPTQIVDGAPKKEDLDLNRRPQQQISSLYQMIGAEVEITRRLEDGKRETIRYRSPLQKNQTDVLRDHFSEMLDKLTTSQQQELPPRININTAPREVLMTLPNLSEADVQVILDQRPGPDTDAGLAAQYRTPAWLITEAGFAPDLVQNLEQYITAQSQVYRMQVLGYYEIAGPMVRLEAVIDTNGGRPKILYWRDITELGRGFDLRGR